MRLTIQKIRMGFATNSSSSHSIVFVPKELKLRDDLRSGDYGWEDFTLVSKDAKDDYLLQTLCNALYWGVRYDKETIRIIANSIFEKDLEEKDITCNIDHQSCMNIPRANKAIDDWRAYQTQSIDLDFFRRLRTLILKDNVAILGGNDNSDDHPLSEKTENSGILSLLAERGMDHIVTRTEGEWITFFNTDNGTKIRFSFEEKPRPYTKALVPELVDVKITDQCFSGCSYCYQGSTPKGKHADSGYINDMLFAFQKYGVFEIALGGGEPTLHPNFENILCQAANCNIVANFSTRNLRIFESNRLWRDSYSFGAIGFSVSSLQEAELFFHYLNKYQIPASYKFVIHCVEGTIPKEDFQRIALMCNEADNVNLLILGYKKKGRGAKKAPPYNFEFSWLQRFKKIEELRWRSESELDREDYYPFHIDTSFARRFATDLEKNNIPKWLYETEEGKFSCYLDCVNQKMGPSSYCDESLMQPANPKNFVQVFSSF